MPQTTTARNACNVRAYLDNGSGVLTDISGTSASVEMDRTVNIGEFRTFASIFMGRLACGKDASFTIDIVYSTTADEGIDIVNDWWEGPDYATPRTLQLDFPDSEAGSERYVMEVLLESAPLPFDPTEAGPIISSISLLPTGDIVSSTIGS